jgi:Domain of unknown function (DUF222)
MPASELTTSSASPRHLDVGAVAKLSTEEIMEMAAASARHMASLAGLIVLLAGELDRREGWRDEGATSLESWLVERLGLSVASARAFAHVGERLFDLPHLAAGLSSGELSFDKVRAVVDTATPETDRELRDQAKEYSPTELSRLARTHKGISSSTSRAEHEGRSLRFNDTFRTVTAQLPAETYAEVRGRLEAAAKRRPSDGETPWDRRLCDGFVDLIRSGSGGRVGSSPYAVVAHVPLEVLLDEGSELSGELDRGGLISSDTVRRLACDATVILAVDDDVGHTMYEGRTRRYPSEAQRREIIRRDRHCRFPGCTNATFVNPHHIIWWNAQHGTTDLPNLVLLCEHHHHLIHSKQWTVSGDANDKLMFAGPSGRSMTSLPSPLWTTVTKRR